MREGVDIGSHRLHFTRVQNGLDIRIDVAIKVTFGPITLFRYRLRGIEQWRDGHVVRLAAKTDDDGTRDFMNADRNVEGLWVTGTRATRYLAPPDALPATHWNEAELHSPWINPQDGRLLRPECKPMGSGPVQRASGPDLTAQHYDISGDVRMQLWYTNTHHWVGLDFAARDGSLVRYELT